MTGDRGHELTVHVPHSLQGILVLMGDGSTTLMVDSTTAPLTLTDVERAVLVTRLRCHADRIEAGHS